MGQYYSALFGDGESGSGSGGDECTEVTVSVAHLTSLVNDLTSLQQRNSEQIEALAAITTDIAQRILPPAEDVEQYNAKTEASPPRRFSTMSARTSISEDSLATILAKSGLDATTKTWLIHHFAVDDDEHVVQESSSVASASRRLKKQYLAQNVDKSMTFPPVNISSAGSIPVALSEYDAEQFGLVDTWSFDIFALSDQQISALPLHIFDRLRLCEQCGIDRSTLAALISRIEVNYHQQPYHSYRHGVDVLHCVYLYIKDMKLSHITAVNIFSLFLAALSHDVGHTATTNQYHCMTQSSIALAYNDNSVLENYHSALLFNIMTNNTDNVNCNVLHSFSRNEYRLVRSNIIRMILATDMSQHFDQLNELDTLLDRLSVKLQNDNIINNNNNNGLDMTTTIIPTVATTDDSDTTQLLCTLLHSADVSNAYRPFHVAEQWSNKIATELLNQGDSERQLGLSISPFADRHDGDDAKVEKMSLNFIDFIVSPLLFTLTHTFQSLTPCAAALQCNRSEWSMRYAAYAHVDDKERNLIAQRAKRFSQTFNIDVVPAAAVTPTEVTVVLPPSPTVLLPVMGSPTGGHRSRRRQNGGLSRSQTLTAHTLNVMRSQFRVDPLSTNAAAVHAVTALDNKSRSQRLSSVSYATQLLLIQNDHVAEEESGCEDVDEQVQTPRPSSRQQYLSAAVNRGRHECRH